MAKPACMNITRNPVINVHMILMAILLWPSAFPITFTAFTTEFKVVSLVAANVSMPKSLMVPVVAPVGSCANIPTGMAVTSSNTIINAGMKKPNFLFLEINAIMMFCFG